MSRSSCSSGGSGLIATGCRWRRRRPNQSGPMSGTGQSTTRKSFITRPPSRSPASRVWEELDPEILRTYEKLGIPLEEQKHLAGVAVDAVFDSVSVATTFKEKLAGLGIIFCSFSEAV